MLKNFLRKLFIIIIELAVVVGSLYYIAQKKGINSVNQIGPAIEKTVQDVQQKVTPFPDPAGPTVKTFNWEYKNKKYALSETLYQSAYEYYKNQPKEYSYSGTLPENWEEEYYAMFLKNNDADKAISILAGDLGSLGKKNKLTEDQIVELAIAFVQSIEYNDAKAENILTKTGKETMLFPYEILYEQKGVCSDKSLLAYAILKEMGYGAALFTYEQNNHMSVAVECSQNYSTYGSGYCYAETTSSGNKIGIIPSIDTESNKAVDLSKYDSSQLQKINLQELGQVTILLTTQGKQYSGIIETEKIMNEINQLDRNMEAILPKIQSQKKIIDEEEKKLKSMENDLGEYENDQDYEKYNVLAEKFNDLLKTYKKDAKSYNSNVELYNQYIKKYNALIKQ